MAKLSLDKERLTELSPDDLDQVAGGAPPTLNIKECVYTAQTVFGCTTAMTCPRPDEA